MRRKNKCKKKTEINDTNFSGNNLVNKVNDKIEILKGNLNSLEKEIEQERIEYENNKNNYETQIHQLTQ